ncbi:MAG: hypothetical protein COA78_19270 [Blastopirellula sp.]|nr:MAG: hypothetical protein COA78_19270 [Blastopirellula sp.]
MSLTRRGVLKAITCGSASFALAPFMRSVAVHAAGKEEALPKRFVFVVKSSGVDRANLVPEGIHNEYAPRSKDGASNIHSLDRDKVIEASFADHALPDSLAAFEEIKDQLTVIQGLSGKNFVGNHTAGYGALSCHHSEQVAVAPTVDCLLGQHVSTGPYPMYGMAMNGHLLEQFFKSPEDSYCYPNLSAMKKGQPVAYQASPRKAYMELFGSAVVSPEQLRRKLTLNSNLMDFMKDDARRIERQLSSDDKQRFANYTEAFESLREREQKKVLLEDRVKQFAPELTSRYDSMVPSVRMDLHFDLATSAMITGLTNVVTLRPDTLGVIYSDLGINQSVHSLGHLGYGTAANGWDGPRARKEIDKLHLSFIAKMAKKFKSIPEGNGTMLDNTTIVYMSCAGGSHHAGQTDWPFILVGGMQDKLKTGRYIQYPSYQKQGHRTIANLYMALMQAAGMQTEDHFGQQDANLKDFDLAGPLAELLT